jgi:hypothetical protein
VLIEIILVALIDYTPLGNFIFGTAPIKANVWLFLVPCAGAMLVAEELRKRFLARSTRPRNTLDPLPTTSLGT